MDNLGLQIEGKIPFEVFEPFLRDFSETRGDINISANLKGTVKKPDLSADVVLDHLGMKVHELE